MPNQPCNCSTCVDDPAFTCSYLGDATVWKARITNARRGNLILSPGGASGVVGGMLHAISPPQHYTHAGIMVSDYDLIRHSTGSIERLSADEYYTGSILGVKVPLDGLNRDHVEWCWPGTITQSAEQAIFGEAEDAYNGANLLDKESTQIPPKTYRINALSFDDVFDGGTWFPALVVKPCPHLETPDVTKALGQIANEAMKIYGHYSFHCYSQALDGGVADFFGPPRSVVDAQPDWDSVNLKWKDWSDPSQIKWISAPFTVPAVCSSLARFIHLGFDFGLAGVA